MKNLIFILSFAFTMFFTNTAFAASVDNSVVDEKTEVVLTETDKVEAVSDAEDCASGRYILVTFSDGSWILFIICD
jgi:hypothetical protein